MSRLSPQSLPLREQAKISWSFSERGLLHSLTFSASDSGFSFSTHLKNVCDPPRSLGNWWTPPHLFPPAHSKLPVSPWKELESHLDVNFCNCCPRNRSPSGLALIANRASIHKPHRTVANKEAVPNAHRSSLLRPHTNSRHRMSRQKFPSPSFFLQRGLNIYSPS